MSQVEIFILIITEHVSGIIMPIVRRKDYVKTACGLCLVVLAAVVQSWDTSCVHCVKVGIVNLMRINIYTCGI